MSRPLIAASDVRLSAGLFACLHVCFTALQHNMVNRAVHGDDLINSYLRSNTDGEMRSHANVLLELLLMRDGTLE
jgi:hypothetical protein